MGEKPELIKPLCVKTPGVKELPHQVTRTLTLTV